MPGAPNSTGAFVGLACQGASGACCSADFDWFEYEARDYPYLDRPPINGVLRHTLRSQVRAAPSRRRPLFHTSGHPTKEKTVP